MSGSVARAGHHPVPVIIGVDTHQDRHVAVAIDRQGVRLGQRYTPATSSGYSELERWSRSLGDPSAFGIEGTGSYGAGIARFLAGRGYTVIEVNRPDRSTRYRKGKSDPTDAEMAARSVLADVAHATPQVRPGRSGDDPYAQKYEGFGRQGSDPGRQPDESSRCHGPGPAARNPRWSLRRHSRRSVR